MIIHPRFAVSARYFGCAALVISLLAGCGKTKDRAGAGGARPEIVATVGDRPISTADLRARLSEQPAFGLGRYKSPERKKELLDGLIRDELLLREAHRRGLEADPEVKAAIERVLIHKLTQVYADENRGKSLPDTELRAYYDEHHSEFATPTRARVSHIFFAAPAGDPRRARAITQANQLLAEVRAQETKGTQQAFELTASKRSEDTATSATGGDLGFKTREELAQTWGSALANAAFALKTAGELGGVVETDRGVHLVKLLGRQEGYDTPFEVARSRIEGRLSSLARSRSVDELVAELKKTTPVRVNEQVLSALDVTAPVPSQSASGTVAAAR